MKGRFAQRLAVSLALLSASCAEPRQPGGLGAFNPTGASGRIALMTRVDGSGDEAKSDSSWILSAPAPAPAPRSPRSLSPHIALREAELPFTLVRVDFAKGRATDDGKILSDVNPKNYVPALLLPNGELLTEGAVIIQYIADQAPEKRLIPPHGSFERVRLQEWLNFLATELHKGFGPLYSSDAGEAYKAAIKQRIELRMQHLAKAVKGRAFLMGDQFTVADGYALYNLRSYRRHVQPELPEPLTAYHDRIVARPSVKAALAAEGIA